MSSIGTGESTKLSLARCFSWPLAYAYKTNQQGGIMRRRAQRWLDGSDRSRAAQSEYETEMHRIRAGMSEQEFYNQNGLPVWCAFICAALLIWKFWSSNPGDYRWVVAGFAGLFGGLVIGVILVRYKKLVMILVALAVVGIYLKMHHQM
jgi:hypothetical protein